MEKLWAGRFKSALDGAADDFNASIRVDARMYREDIEGSQAHAAHARRLRHRHRGGGRKDSARARGNPRRAGRRPAGDRPRLPRTSTRSSKKRSPRASATPARSCTPRAAATIRWRWTRACTCGGWPTRKKKRCCDLVRALVALGQGAHRRPSCPATRTCSARSPSPSAHHLLAYANMFLRDLERLADCRARMNRCPLGAAALAGTTYPIDRVLTAAPAGLRRRLRRTASTACPTATSCIELAFVNAMIDDASLPAWPRRSSSGASWEFRFVELDGRVLDRLVALCRRRKTPTSPSWSAARPAASTATCIALLTRAQGPAAGVQQGYAGGQGGRVRRVDTVLAVPDVFAPMLETMTVCADDMRRAADGGASSTPPTAPIIWRRRACPSATRTRSPVRSSPASIDAGTDARDAAARRNTGRLRRFSTTTCTRRSRLCTRVYGGLRNSQRPGTQRASARSEPDLQIRKD